MFKVGYLGIDFLDETLKVLLSREDVHILKIFTCETDNKTEFNLEVVSLAKENGIPYTYKRISDNDIDELIEMGANLIISSGYYYKIPAREDIPIINIHPALLPVGRGAWPMPVTILKGLSESGITIHKISNEFDKGDILTKEKFSVDNNENLLSIIEKDSFAIKIALNRVLDDFDNIYSNANQQEYGEYWKCPTQEDYTITLEMDDADIDLILRAFYSYEVYLKCNNEQYELIFGRLIHEKPSKVPYFKTKNGSYIIANHVKKII